MQTTKTNGDSKRILEDLTKKRPTRKAVFGYNFGKLSVAIIPASQDKAEASDWQSVNPDTLPDALADAYETYKAAYAKTKQLRLEFETAMRNALGCVAGSPQRRSTGGVSFSDL